SGYRGRARSAGPRRSARRLTGSAAPAVPWCSLPPRVPRGGGNPGLRRCNLPAALPSPTPRQYQRRVCLTDTYRDALLPMERPRLVPRYAPVERPLIIVLFALATVIPLPQW